MNPPRVVIDTNCLVSALFFSQENLAWLRWSWQNGQFTPLVSQQTVGELIRVLGYPKFRLSAKQQEILLAEFLPYAEPVSISNRSPGLPSLRDPQDVMFLELAITGKAEVLVSGDADILELRHQVSSPRILTLAEFARWLKNR